MWVIVGAIIVSGTIAIFTDWLFMGLQFHSAYMRYPEVWWPRGGNNTVAVIWSSIIGYLMSAGRLALCSGPVRHRPARAYCSRARMARGATRYPSHQRTLYHTLALPWLVCADGAGRDRRRHRPSPLDALS